MRRNDINSLLCEQMHSVARSMAVLVLFFVIAPLGLFAQGVTRSYEVLSATPQEVVVRIAPKYAFDTVSTETGNAVRIRFIDGSFASAVGAPGVMKLPLGVILPSAVAPKIEVLSEKYETYSGLELAPVP